MMSEQLLPYSDTLGGYDRWAASYDAQPNAIVTATSWVLDRAPLGCADCDVLELGCGTGRNVRRILSEGARSYLGLDASGGMLHVATQRHVDPRVTFGAADLLGMWAVPKQYDFALVVLVIEHLHSLEPLLVSLARAIKPGGRARIIDLHPERVAAGTNAHFHDGERELAFTSFAHDVPMLCAATEAVGFDPVRRDWLATDTMVSEVPSIAKHRGLRVLLDLKLTRRQRDRRGSSGL